MTKLLDSIFYTHSQFLYSLFKNSFLKSHSHQSPTPVSPLKLFFSRSAITPSLLNLIINSQTSYFLTRWRHLQGYLQTSSKYFFHLTSGPSHSPDCLACYCSCIFSGWSGQSVLNPQCSCLYLHWSFGKVILFNGLNTSDVWSTLPSGETSWSSDQTSLLFSCIFRLVYLIAYSIFTDIHTHCMMSTSNTTLSIFFQILC